MKLRHVFPLFFLAIFFLTVIVTSVTIVKKDDVAPEKSDASSSDLDLQNGGVSFFVRSIDRDAWNPATNPNHTCVFRELVDNSLGERITIKKLQDAKIRFEYVKGNQAEFIETDIPYQNTHATNIAQTKRPLIEWQTLHRRMVGFGFNKVGPKQFITIYIDGIPVSTKNVAFSLTSINMIEGLNSCGDKFYISKIKNHIDSGIGMANEVVYQESGVPSIKTLTGRFVVNEITNLEFEYLVSGEMINNGDRKEGIMIRFPHLNGWLDYNSNMQIGSSHHQMWQDLQISIKDASNGLDIPVIYEHYDALASNEYLAFYPQQGSRFVPNQRLKIKINNIKAPMYTSPNEFIFYENANNNRYFFRTATQPNSINLKSKPYSQIYVLSPSKVKKGTQVEIIVRAEDEYYNIDRAANVAISVTSSDSAVNVPNNLRITQGIAKFVLTFNTEGVHNITVQTIGNKVITSKSFPIKVVSASSNEVLYWGTMHEHSNVSDGKNTPSELYRIGRDEVGLDFMTVIDHIELWGWSKRLTESQNAANTYNSSGNFVTMNGYESNIHQFNSSAGVGFDWNFYFNSNNVDLYGHTTINDIWSVLQNNVFVVPHHGGPNPRSISSYFELLDSANTTHMPVVDVCRMPGRTEAIGLAALAMGYRVGFMGGTDDHTGYPGRTADVKQRKYYPDVNYLYALYPGLASGQKLEQHCNTAVIDGNLDRSGIYNSFKNRKTYVATEKGMLLEYRINNNGEIYNIGGEYTTSSNSVNHEILVGSLNPIRHIEIVKGQLTTKSNKETFNPLRIDVTNLKVCELGGTVCSVSYNDIISSDPSYSRGGVYYLRFLDNNYREAWSSPIWVTKSTTIVPVSNPVFNPSGGTYTSTQTVTISTATTDATIRYTMDGSTPSSTTGTIYSTPITISSTTTLKAIAYKTGSNPSSVSTASYTINTGGTTPPSGTVADPTFVATPIGENSTFNTSAIIQLSTATNGATIRYTTNGTTPTSTNGTIYSSSSPITITTTTTIKAIAYKSGMTNSSVVSRTYTQSSGATTQVVNPVINPSATTFTSSVSVSISSSTSGATIRYTTNGTTPSTTNGTIYSAPFTLTNTTTVKAIVYKTGMTNSGVVSKTYTKSSSSTSSLVIFAKGTIALRDITPTSICTNGYPNMVVKYDNVQVGRRCLDSTYPSSGYSYTINTTNADPSKVTIHFTNDYSVLGVEDRNMIIEKIVLNGTQTILPSNLVYAKGQWTPTYGCGLDMERPATYSNRLGCNGYMRLRQL